MERGTAPVSTGPAAGHPPATGGPDLSRLKIARDEGPAPRRRRRWPWVVVVLLLAGAAGLAYQQGWVRFESPVRALVVTVAKVERPGGAAAVTGQVTGNGYVIARQKAALSTVLSGRLVEVNVEEGMTVKKDQPVARIQHDDYDAAVVQAKKDVAVAEGKVAEQEKSLAASRLDLDRLHGENAVLADLVTQAEAEAERAGQDLERNRDLHEKKLIEDGVWDRLRSTKAAADAALSAARGRVAAGASAETAWKGEIARREAALATARKEVERFTAAQTLAEIALEKTYVRAPFDGIVIHKDAEVGEVVSSTGASGNSRGSVATIVNVETLEAQVELAETRLGTIREGDPTVMVLDADRDLTEWPGRVRQVWPTADRQKATVEMRVEFLKKPPILKPEMGVRVTFLPRGAEAKEPVSKAIRVSKRAVVAADGKTSVFTVSGGVARKVAVEVGPEANGTVEVRSGLSGGEWVVLDPPAGLVDGRKVETKEAR